MQLPTAWLDVLTKVQTQYPSAVIAGGCLRDLDYGLQPKDVDIFIPDARGEIIDDASATLYRLFGEAKEVFGDISSQYDYVRDIKLVQKYTINGLDFDIIFEHIKDKEQTVIDTFDFSICQIMHDGKETTVSRDYELTKANQMIYCTRYDEDTFQARVKRLAEKFPEMRWQVPQDTALVS